MDEDLPSFGDWLQRRRQALHLTQQELGRLARCSVATIRKLESEERRPSPDVAALPIGRRCDRVNVILAGACV